MKAALCAAFRQSRTHIKRRSWAYHQVSGKTTLLTSPTARQIPASNPCRYRNSKRRSICALCSLQVAVKTGELLHRPLPLLSVSFLLEPLGSGIFLFLQVVDLGLIWCERLDGFDACYLCNLHKKLLVLYLHRHKECGDCASSAAMGWLLQSMPEAAYRF